MVKDCPKKPVQVCRNCQQEGKYKCFLIFSSRTVTNCRSQIGHMVAECKNPRKVDRSHIEIIDAELAWDKAEKAAKDKNAVDLKEAIEQYVKACPDTTYVQLEGAFRSQGIGAYLIAMENPAMASSFTNMDLQGNLDKKYRVHYRFDPKPNRPRERLFWPSSDEENLERLEDAGDTVSRGLSKCSNCNELGHIAKNCPQETMERERLVITCVNCQETGHRMRDCEYIRVDNSHFLTNVLQALKNASTNSLAGTAGMFSQG